MSFSQFVDIKKHTVVLSDIKIRFFEGFYRYSSQGDMQPIIPFRASVPIEKPESVYVEQEDGGVLANWRGLLEAIENKKHSKKSSIEESK